MCCCLFHHTVKKSEARARLLPRPSLTAQIGLARCTESSSLTQAENDAWGDSDSVEA